MPPIKDAIQKNAQRIAAGEQLVQPAAKDVGPASTDGPFVAPASPVVTGLPVRGAYTPNLTLHTDFQNNTQGLRTGPNIRSATFPSPQTSSSSIVSKIVAAATAAVSSLVIKVNNALAPNQNLINLLNGTGMIITVDAAGNIVFNSTSSGDGLTHSTAPWESDPAYIILRDDFTHTQSVSGQNTTPPISNIGQLGWVMDGTIGTHGSVFGGIPPYLGQFYWDQNGTTNNFGILRLEQTGNIGGNAGANYGWALFDNPGSQLTWVFRFGSQSAGVAVTPFFAGKAMYLGYCGTQQTENISTNPSARPEVFFGVRYDTSGYVGVVAGYACTAITMSGSNMAITGTFTGANQIAGTSWVGLTFTTTGFANGANNGTFICTAATTTTLTLTNPNGVNAAAQSGTASANTPFVLTAAANGNGTQVAYTGTITGGGTNNFVGQMFYVSGFGNAGNNGGPWKCTANSTTSITLANPVATGSAETHAGYAGSPTLNDTTLVLEAVQNPSYGAVGRNNTQGTTLNTGITPTIGTWHRLDVFINAAGSITITLDGTYTLTTAVSKQSITTASLGLTGSVANNQLSLVWTATPGTLAVASPWATGSQVTVAGFSGTQASFNATWTLLSNTALGVSPSLIIDYSAATTVASAGVTGTLSGYPAVFPAAIFGNGNVTDTASSLSFWLDFFSFVWNPNLGPSAPGTPTSTLPRYW